MIEFAAPLPRSHEMTITGYRKWSNKRPGRYLILGVQEGAFNRWEAFILVT